MYQFETPYIEEGVDTGHRLFNRMRFRKGISVLRIDDEYIEMRYPSQDEIAIASVYYMGGHTYKVSNAEAANLQAAGYTVTAL
jgi:hypothetical protein